MLYYITFAHIPTKKAFGYAIARTCSSLAEHTLVTLVISKTDQIEEDVFSFYNLPKNFSVLPIPTLNLYPYKFLGNTIPFYARKISFFISMFFHLKATTDDVAYTRDVWGAIIMRLRTPKVFLEAHYFRWVDIASLFLFRAPRKFVVITKYLENKLIGLGYLKNNIIIFPSGTDVKDLAQKMPKNEIREKLALPLEKKIVSYIGKYKTMGVAKGVEDIIEIFPDILKRFPDALILLVGIDEDEKVEVTSRFSALSVSQDSYRIVSHVKHDVAVEYMEASDILIMNYPDQPHYRNVMSPIKLFEYMASGTPIVTSDLPSIREVVSEGEVFFFKPDDRKAMLEAIVLALSDAHKADMISKSAFEKVKAYSWEKRAETILKFIQ